MIKLFAEGFGDILGESLKGCGQGQGHAVATSSAAINGDELILVCHQVLLPLMDKCNVALDSSLIKHPFFSPASAMR